MASGESRVTNRGGSVEMCEADIVVADDGASSIVEYIVLLVLSVDGRSRIRTHSRRTRINRA